MDEGIGGGMGGLLEKMQAAQSQVEAMQKELATRRFEGEAGGGSVRAVANGSLELVSLKIDPSVIDPEDAEMLEDLVTTAVGRALQTARDAVAQQMTGGLLGGGLSGLLG